jgi:cardiolipin synthase
MKETLWKFYTSNEETLIAMIEACESATETIDLEQFIFVPDSFGNRLIEICARKASQGVKVRFIWDAAGSFTLFGSGIVEDLKSKGIELIFFKTLFPGFFDVPNYRSWYFRNHRRTLVIDGKVGFTGSICIYERMKDWRDTNIKIEGLVVQDMQKAFNRMWDRAHGKKLPRIKHEKTSDHEFRYISNNPIPRHRRLYHQVLEAIRNSRKYVYITTPYFVPTHHLARVLRLAAHRGVDVKIIIPESSDQTFVDLSSKTFFHGMLKSGVRLFQYKGKMLHSKTVVVDGDWSSIGTLNMDNVSLLYNFEANIISTNGRFTEELASHFVYDMTNCEEMTLEKWNERNWTEKVAGFFMKFIRGFF